MMDLQMLFRCWYHKAIKSKILLIISLLFLLANSGCGPKVFNAAITPAKLRTLILLPPTYEAAVTREKVDYVNDIFRRKLIARGFNLVSENLFGNYCPSSNCSDLSNLRISNDIDGIAKISVSETSSTNLLAGNYQSISGTGLLYDRYKIEIARVEHTESERGGLLFNSGQVLQGIQSTVESFSENSFSKLADKFIEKIVTKFPSPAGTLELAELEAGETEFQLMGNGRLKVCIHSDNAESITIRADKISIPLRQSTSRNFCSNFILDPVIISSGWTAILLGKYGETKSIAINQIPLEDCLARENIKRSSTGLVWSSSNLNCQGLSFVAFGANQPSGPFSMIGRLAKPGMEIKLAQPQPEVVVIIALSKKLGVSKPLILK